MPAPKHVYQIYIRASQAEVWQAITDPEFTRRYFHGTAIETSLQPGSRYRYIMADGSDAVAGTIEIAEPPERLVMTWQTLYDAALAEEPPSRVEWLLVPSGDGMTKLTAIHRDLGRSPRTSQSVGGGWVWIIGNMKTLLETGEPLPPAAAETSDGNGEQADADLVAVDAEDHRRLAIDANKSIWELLDRKNRTESDDEDLVRRAYAAAYHWGRAEPRGPENEARAEYMIAKVLWTLGRGETARHHARRCLAVTTAAGLDDFDLAYAHEAMARASALMGDESAAAEHWATALAVPVADDEDRAILEADFADRAT